MSGSALSVALSFFAAAVGWLVLEFLGRPFRKFFDLRGEVIYVLTLTANVRAQYNELRDSPGTLEELDLSDDDRNQLRAAQISFRKMASRMTAFAVNETTALLLVKILGYKPSAAAAALIGVANTRAVYGADRIKHMKDLAKALRLPKAV
jgi:hypothetical protein